MAGLAPKMEPEWSNRPGPASERFLNVLLMAGYKAGKSCAAVGTTPGPVYVINCDQPGSLEPVKKIYPNAIFAQNLVHSRAKMEDALVLARSLAKEGKIKTVVLDTLSGFAGHLEEECAAQTMNDKGEPDGRRYWPVYTKYLISMVGRLSKIPCHLVVCSHWIDTGGSDEMAGGVSKTGPGIVPLLGRAARARIGGEFTDVLFLDKVKNVPGVPEGRAFLTGIEGVWGPGCRSIAKDMIMPADFREFMKAAEFPGANKLRTMNGGLRK